LRSARWINCNNLTGFVGPGENTITKRKAREGY
jgi:hypothetical protein